MEKVKCTVCDNGKITITIKETGKSDQKWITDCMECEGTGEITKEQAADIEREKNMWCKCGKSDDAGVTYYNDGEHSELYKHHYRCNACGKVVQIG
jgi:hypothetical protein